MPLSHVPVGRQGLALAFALAKPSGRRKPDDRLDHAPALMWLPVLRFGNFGVFRSDMTPLGTQLKRSTTSIKTTRVIMLANARADGARRRKRCINGGAAALLIDVAPSPMARTPGPNSSQAGIP